MAHGLPSESLSSGTIPPRPPSINTPAPTNGLTEKGRCKLERRGKLQTQGQSRYVSATTINTLPDSVLLEIFDLCQMDHDTHSFPFRRPIIFEWGRIVEVCQRWRHIVIASPIRLGLQFLCTHGIPVRKNLGYWPPFPLIVDYTYRGAHDGDSEGLTPSDEDGVVAALEHPDRVRYVGISVTKSLMEKMAVATHDPFPALTHLCLSSKDGDVPVLPETFLGGSVPSLRFAYLEGIPFPSLPKLLLSATSLVNLQLLNIPKSGFVSPNAMVAGLAALTRLETLSIGFQSPISLPDRGFASEPPERIPILSLTTFNFRGVSEYLEDLVARIDTPLLKNVTITYFNRLTFQIPQLSQFIGRTEGFHLFRFKHPRVNFSDNNVYVRLDCDHAEQLGGHFTLQILCQGSEWQVSHMAQVLAQCFPPPIATPPSVDDLSVDMCRLQPCWEADVGTTTERPALLTLSTAAEMLQISSNLGGSLKC